MKRNVEISLFCLALCLTLSVPIFAGGRTESSSIRVSLTELKPGYYLGAIWDGEELLTLFDYTVGLDGKLETTVELGKKLDEDKTVKVGVSGENTNSEPIVQMVRPDAFSVSDQPDAPDRPSGGTGSGSGFARYNISVPSVTGGSVTVFPSSAAAGSQITLTVKADSGYNLSSLNVTDSKGNDVKLTEGSDGKYTFTMPNSKVIVLAKFEPVFSEPNLSTPEYLPFTDVASGDWCYTAVKYAYENGLMSGVSSTNFAPNMPTTRAMIVTILYNLEGKPSAGSNGFQDVAANMWYTAPIAWAAQIGVVHGYDAARFGPNDTITREQMAVILHNYAKYKECDLSSGTNLSDFTDANQISSYAQTAMQWTSANGLINGMGNGVLDPKGSATRAQAATILMNFCEVITK